MISADIELLRHAASLLAADATCLRESHNADPQHPDWSGEEDAKAAHDDALCTALRLRTLAKRMRASQAAVTPAPTSAD